MPILDPATMLALAIQCAPPRTDPRLVWAVAKVESGFNTDARNHNRNRTDDNGLMQINSSHGIPLPVLHSACGSIAAGVAILAQAAGGDDALQPGVADRLADRLAHGLSVYHRGEQPGVDQDYIDKILHAYRGASAAAVRIQEVQPDQPAAKTCNARPSDVWAQAACRDAAEAEKGDGE